MVLEQFSFFNTIQKTYFLNNKGNDSSNHCKIALLQGDRIFSSSFIKVSFILAGTLVCVIQRGKSEENVTLNIFI